MDKNRIQNTGDRILKAWIRKSGYQEVGCQENSISGLSIEGLKTVLISVNLCLTEPYLKKQNQSRASPGNPKYEYLNPKRFDGYVLKKQSQFSDG